MAYVDIDSRENNISQDYTSEEIRQIRRQRIVQVSINFVLIVIFGFLIYTLFSL